MKQYTYLGYDGNKQYLVLSNTAKLERKTKYELVLASGEGIISNIRLIEGGGVRVSYRVYSGQVWYR